MLCKAHWVSHYLQSCLGHRQQLDCKHEHAMRERAPCLHTTNACMHRLGRLMPALRAAAGLRLGRAHGSAQAARGAGHRRHLPRCWGPRVQSGRHQGASLVLLSWAVPAALSCLQASVTIWVHVKWPCNAPHCSCGGVSSIKLARESGQLTAAMLQPAEGQLGIFPQSLV